MILDEREYTIEELAKELRVHPETIRLKIRKREIRGARKQGCEWRIPESRLREYLATTYQQSA